MSSDEDVPLIARRPEPEYAPAPAPVARAKREPKEKRKNVKGAAARVHVNPDAIWAGSEKKRPVKEHQLMHQLRTTYNKKIKPYLGAIAFGVLAFMFMYLRLREEFYDHDKALAMMHDSDDPFKVLEVGRNATGDDIKKAYFKLSLKWHPDKNPNCAECTTKFQQIGVAYKKLKDNDSREKVLKGMEEKASSKTDEDSPIPSETFSLTDSNFDAEVAKKDAWLIKVYTDWSTASWDALSDWEATYEDIGKYVPMGRVNFAKESELAARFKVYDVPTFISYVGGKSAVFRGRPNAQNLTNFMLDSLRESRWRITDNNANIFLRENEDKVRVLLFANKDLSKLRLVYRMLARQYRQHMVLGEVSQLDSPGLFHLYNMTKDKPSLLFIKEKGVKPLRYSGAMTWSKLQTLFEEHKFQVVPRLTSANVDDLCSRPDNISCVLFFQDAAPADQRETILSAMRNASRAASELATATEEDSETEVVPSFAMTDLSKQGQLGAALNVSASGPPYIVALQKEAGRAVPYTGDPTNATAILEWSMLLSDLEEYETNLIAGPVHINYEAPPINFKHLWRTVQPYITASLVVVVIGLLWFAANSYYQEMKLHKTTQNRLKNIKKQQTKESKNVHAEKHKEVEERNRRQAEQRQREREAQEKKEREAAASRKVEAASAPARSPSSGSDGKLNPTAPAFQPRKPASESTAKPKAEKKKAEPKKEEAKKAPAKPKGPSPAELSAKIKEIVLAADLTTTTRRGVRERVSNAFPDIDLTNKYEWIGSEIDRVARSRS